MLSPAARWPEPNAGWRDGMCVEVFLGLDFPPEVGLKFSFFLHPRLNDLVGQEGKKDKRKVRCACPTTGGNTFEVLVSQASANASAGRLYHNSIELILGCAAGFSLSLACAACITYAYPSIVYG